MELIIALLFSLIIYHEIYRYRSEKERIEQYNRFDDFLDCFKKSYISEKRVDESLKYADEKCHHRFNKYVESILEESDNREYGNNEFESIYERVFKTQIKIVREYGDSESGGESNLLKNVGEISDELRNDIIETQNRKIAFAGAGIVSIIPILFFYPIEQWCVKYIPELSIFYLKHGIMLRLFITMISVLIYCFIDSMRSDPYKNSKSQYGIMIGFFKSERLFSYVRKLYSLWNKVELMIKKRNSFYNMLFYKQNSLLSFFEKLLCFLAMFILDLIIIIDILISGHKSQSNVLEPAYAAVFILLPFAGVYIPKLISVLKKRKELFFEDIEFSHFYFLISSLIHCNGMSVYKLLEGVEDSTAVLKRRIRKLKFNYDRIQESAFETEKSQTKNEMYKKILDGLSACEKNGVEVAFSDIERERMYLKEKTRIEIKEKMKKRSNLVNLLAYIPVSMVFLLYLVIPFAVECFKQLDSLRMI